MRTGYNVHNIKMWAQINQNIPGMITPPAGYAFSASDKSLLPLRYAYHRLAALGCKIVREIDVCTPIQQQLTYASGAGYSPLDTSQITDWDAIDLACALARAYGMMITLTPSFPYSSDWGTGQHYTLDYARFKTNYWVPWVTALITHLKGWEDVVRIEPVNEIGGQLLGSTGPSAYTNCADLQSVTYNLVKSISPTMKVDLSSCNYGTQSGNAWLPYLTAFGTGASSKFDDCAHLHFYPNNNLDSGDDYLVSAIPGKISTYLSNITTLFGRSDVSIIVGETAEATGDFAGLQSMYAAQGSSVYGVCHFMAWEQGSIVIGNTAPFYDEAVQGMPMAYGAGFAPLFNIPASGADRISNAADTSFVAALNALGLPNRIADEAFPGGIPPVVIKSAQIQMS
jgi:hypothetical protein